MSVFLAQLATLGPIGRYPPAPGTVGSVSALITGFFLAKNGFITLFLALLLVTILGVFAADAYSQLTGTDDAGEVIIDEVAGQWLVLLCIQAIRNSSSVLVPKQRNILKRLHICILFL